MRPLCRIESLVAILCLLSACSTSGIPHNLSPLRSPPRLPDDLSEIRNPGGGSGRVLLSSRPLSRERISVLVETLATLSEYLDHDPEMMAAMDDVTNKGIQGSFVATMENKAIKGAVFAYPGETDISVYCIYDYAEALPESYERLTALLNRSRRVKSCILTICFGEKFRSPMVVVRCLCRRAGQWMLPARE